MSDLARFESRRAGDTQHVRVIGEVDLSNARALLDAVAAAVPDEAAALVLDLTSTTYLDSAGIALLFGLAATLRRHQQELRLVVISTSPIARMVALTGLASAVPTHESIEAATAD